jgi:outer membrane protein assembly factor BamB
MTVSRLASVIVVSSVIFGAIPAHAGDWPQWRGPDRNGRAAESGLLQEWPEGGPPLAWKAAGVGAGYSSVAVTGGKIYTMGDLDGGQHVIALEDGNGKILWKTHVGPSHKDKYIGTRSTPTVVGDKLYVVTTEGGVFCLTTKSGEVVWQRDLRKDFNGYLMKAMGSYDWKFAESPLVDGNRVIVTPGHISALMVALDAGSGEEIWRTQGRDLGEAGRDGAGYSSAVVSEAGGVRQYVQLYGRGAIGVEAKTGKLLWGYNRVANDVANISTPIVRGDYVFVSTGYGTGSALLQIKRDGESWKADEIYFLEADTMQNHHGGLILDGDTVYTGTGHNKGFPLAVDLKTGKVAWGPERNEGTRSAAIAYADGRLYFRYENGLVVLLDATPEGYHERGSLMIPDVEQFSWPHPVIANGKLYLREQDNLYVYDLKKTAKSAGP